MFEDDFPCFLEATSQKMKGRKCLPNLCPLKKPGVFSLFGLGRGGFLAEVVLFLCETQAFLRSERRTDVALDSNQASGTTRTRFKALVQFERPPKGYGGFGR